MLTHSYVKNQIPKIDNYIIELNNVATKLSFIKNELEEQVTDVKDNYENFANQVENSTKKMKKLNEDVNKSRYEMEFIKQELLGNSEIFGELLKGFENQSLDNHKKIMNELKEVKSTLNEDRLLAKRRGKVQWMTLVSFLAVGILIYSQL
jgi:uncharacterized protein YPO0396